MAALSNKEKTPPKTEIKFSLTLSEEQKAAKAMIMEAPFNFIVGKAGSGKTLLAVQIALDMYFKRRIDKIVITRPTVSNEDNGFLPGSLSEKMDPWLVPIRSNMRKVYNKPDILDKMESEENIEWLEINREYSAKWPNISVKKPELPEADLYKNRVAKKSLLSPKAGG